MARVIDRLWLRLTLVVLVIQAVLLPLLFYRLLIIVEKSHADAFVDQMRSYGRILADEMEIGDGLSTPSRTLTLLDSVILSGRGVYAEIVENGKALRSDLIARDVGAFHGDDFKFNSGGDHIYFISAVVTKDTRNVVLRLGFDETETLEYIKRARVQILLALGAFTSISVALAIWLAARLARPMTHLTDGARRIADGDVNSRLEFESSIYEVRELTRHLESMRRELVGTNERLAGEILKRAAGEAERRSLEQRLRHRERIVTVGTLAGGIAHEFNNIMTPILLYAQDALDELPRDLPIAEDLSRVIAAAHRARSLVNRVLTFSRDIGDEPQCTVRLGVVVDEVLSLLRALVPSNIEIVRRGVDDAPIVGDPGLIHQLIMNLCTNAFQAMQVSGGVLTVTLSQEHTSSDARVEPGDHVVLEVLDTGQGMDEETRERIFDPFFSTREVGAGTGLGLSVVHGIATGMNAAITVDSKPGGGAKFRVYFPVHEATDALIAQASAHIEPRRPPASDVE
jgi:signal transduction histidine kinase